MSQFGFPGRSPRSRFGSAGMSRPFLGLVAALVLSAPVAAQKPPSFEIRLGADGETIGSAQPVFIELRPEAVPDISLKEVARRYRKLLDNAEDPEVRVDALHRLTNLQSLAGDQLDISPEEERALYRQAVDSYEMIVGSGVYYGRIDELLYQNAKAYAFIGEEENSIKRLEQLIGLYPDSDYALESRFRIAEHAFSLGDFETAERAYGEVIRRDGGGRFADKAEYMLGWSQFKLDRQQAAAGSFISVLDRYAEREGGFEGLSAVEANVVDDTFRILSIIAAYEGGAQMFERLLADRQPPSYEYLLYDRLADYYLANERYDDSVAANEAFIAKYPAHPQSPALARQIVSTYEAGRFEAEAIGSREDYIERFGAEERYAQLDSESQQAVRDYLDHVGRHYYRRGQDASQGTTRLTSAGSASVEGPSIGAESRAFYETAAGYLEHWTRLLDNGFRGEQLVLAADAWVRAGEPEKALPLYEIAGYREGEYDRAEDAAYAAVMIYRRGLEQAPDDPAALHSLIDATERYLRIHVEDPRTLAVRAYTANLMFDRGHQEQAEAMALPLTHDDRANEEQRRAGLLIVANVAYNTEQYDAAERYYRQALDEMPAGLALRSETAEKLAATIYRQGEVAASAGQTDRAVAQFLRVANANPGSPIAMKARYDAANTLLAATRWDAAINALLDFKQRYPDSELYEAADDKLLHAYESAGEFGKAADTLLAQVDRRTMPTEERWKLRIAAAEWYEKAARDASARGVYRRYLAEGTSAFGSHEYQQELRWQLAEHARAEGDEQAARRGYQDLLANEEQTEGSERSSYLAGQSALYLAQASAEAFRDIRLTEPLRESLQRKRSALQTAIRQYEQAQQFGIAEVTSEATYAIAELYRTLARDMLESEPPSELNDLQRQQYTMLLEEQAYPFEEEAISLHQQNHALIEDRLWNPWIDKSLQSLAEIYPARYSRESQWMEWSSEEVSP